MEFAIEPRQCVPCTATQRQKKSGVTFDEPTNENIFEFFALGGHEVRWTDKRSRFQGEFVVLRIHQVSIVAIAIPRKRENIAMNEQHSHKLFQDIGNVGFSHSASNKSCSMRQKPEKPLSNVFSVALSV